MVESMRIGGKHGGKHENWWKAWNGDETKILKDGFFSSD
jgi:hypothetical protein